MLERVNFNEAPLDKAEYKALRDELTQRLVVLQQDAIKNGAGLVVLFEGWDGAGKGSRISDLMYFLDARATSVYVATDIDKDEQEVFEKLESGVTGYEPIMKEFWDACGERGHITFYDQGWYTKAALTSVNHDIIGFTGKKLKQSEFINQCKDFEEQLSDDGYTVVKFFVHVSKKAQKERLEELRENPATKFRVSKKKINRVKLYDKAYEAYDRLLSESNFDFAPWTLINGEDSKRANIEIMKTMIEALECAIQKAQSKAATSAKIEVPEGADAKAIAQAQHSFAPRGSSFEIEQNYPHVEEIRHDLKLERPEYKKKLKKLQHELYELECMMYQERVPLIVMFEGWDAAGKGGAIKRVAQALDARAYTIVPSPAPSKQELAHQHLWRYWTRIPKAGHVGLFDRSWYGRVLVERCEEITRPADWARGYDEINEFERDLIEWGAILIKFWVNVSPEEQLNRFEARKADPNKQWKITDEDWRNREKYEQYRSAIDDMFRLTSTTQAPWTILESDDKLYARIKCLETIVDALKERLHVKID